MAAITPIGAARVLGGEIVKSIIADIVKDQGAKQLRRIEDWGNKSGVQKQFNDSLNALGQDIQITLRASPGRKNDGKRAKILVTT